MESDIITLEITSPTNTQTFHVEWIEIESPTGSFLVGPNHIPLVSIIKKKSKLLYKKAGEGEFSIEIFGGIFKVQDNKATILLDN